VEELDKIADKFARDDKGPQPAVTDYRGMATEMPVATSKFPTTRYSLVELCPKPGASTSCAAILRICAIRLLATASTVICARTAARPSILAAIV
jgi:tRNA pseudouridine65 synthase